MKQFKRTLLSYKIKHHGLTPSEVRSKRVKDMITRTLQKRANSVNAKLVKFNILSRIKPLIVNHGHNILRTLDFRI